MKLKKLDPLLVNIMDDYWEWLEMGHPLEDLLFSLLKKEREKTEVLEWKLNLYKDPKNG